MKLPITAEANNKTRNYNYRFGSTQPSAPEFLPKDAVMITKDIKIRVRYYETDCMGIVHHSNYIRYYETARTEMLREFGTTYNDMEKHGVMLPVLEVQSRHIAPAYDDDLLTVRVTLAEMPKVKMRFDYEIFRENGDKINTGSVTLAFMHSDSRRACRAPEWFLKLLEPYF